MTQHLLYSFRRCPFAMRARMALKYADIDVHILDILLKDKPKSMLDVSPKATVPVLVIDHLTNHSTTKQCQVIDESIDIMFWAINQSDQEQWYVDLSKALQQQINHLILKFDNEFKPLLDQYKYASRFPELTFKEHREKALSYLELLDNRLTQHTCLMAENITIADIAIFPFIRQFAFVDKRWFDESKYTRLQSWLEKHLNSELFQTIMIKS